MDIRLAARLEDCIRSPGEVSASVGCLVLCCVVLCCVVLCCVVFCCLVMGCAVLSCVVLCCVVLCCVVLCCVVLCCVVLCCVVLCCVVLCCVVLCCVVLCCAVLWWLHFAQQPWSLCCQLGPRETSPALETPTSHAADDPPPPPIDVDVSQGTATQLAGLLDDEAGALSPLEPLPPAVELDDDPAPLSQGRYCGVGVISHCK